MKIWILINLFCLNVFFGVAQEQKIPFEISGGKRTTTYTELISFYEQLDKKYSEAKLIELGPSDSGEPLHIFIISSDQVFDPSSANKENQVIALVINGIHSGEPDGIDASMMFCRDLLSQKNWKKRHAGITYLIMPVYSVGGIKNQSAYRRANQNGPENYGSRGNAKNLDLNRDFIKTDSRNSATFQSFFTSWKPNFFIDTHVSNGADYKATSTLVVPQEQKMGGPLGEYVKQVFTPLLITNSKRRELDLIPYVNVFGKDPREGYNQFFDSPRYSTGYAALHHSIGYMLENHMLKSFDKRVEAALAFLWAWSDCIRDQKEIIGPKVEAQKSFYQNSSTYPVNWEVNLGKPDSLLFNGYIRKERLSELTGDSHYYYDRESPYSEYIPYFNYFEVVKQVDIPFAYYIPPAWSELKEFFDRNKIQYEILEGPQEDFEAEQYRIVSFETSNRPNGGHYFHYQTKVESESVTISPEKGGLIIPTKQEGIRYVLETLEPEAPDSYFAWNFFDQILQRHEWYSNYVFHDYAESWIEDHPDWNNNDVGDTTDVEDQRNILFEVFEQSPYKEPEYLRYPVLRIMSQMH